MRMVSLRLRFTERKHLLGFTLALEHKFGLVYTLLDRCFCFVSDMSKFQLKLKNLRKYFYLTDVPTNSLIDAFRNL